MEKLFSYNENTWSMFQLQVLVVCLESSQRKSWIEYTSRGLIFIRHAPFNTFFSLTNRFQNSRPPPVLNYNLPNSLIIIKKPANFQTQTEGPKIMFQLSLCRILTSWYYLYWITIFVYISSQIMCRKLVHKSRA